MRSGPSARLLSRNHAHLLARSRRSPKHGRR
jgi:hypothetical protein